MQPTLGVLRPRIASWHLFIGLPVRCPLPVTSIVAVATSGPRPREPSTALIVRSQYSWKLPRNAGDTRELAGARNTAQSCW